MASERVEVITRAERRRRWSSAEKLRLVLATREPGATVASVAREHGVSESLLYTWRGRLARGGLVDASRATSLRGFVPVTVVSGQPGIGYGFRRGVRRAAANDDRDRAAERLPAAGPRASRRQHVAQSDRRFERHPPGMLTPRSGSRIYLALRPVDMRKGFDGLAAQVQQVLQEDPFGGQLFLFRSPSGRSVEGGMVGRDRPVPVRQAAGARPLRLLWPLSTASGMRRRSPLAGTAAFGCTRSAWVRTPGSRDGRSGSYAGVGYPMMTVRRRAASLWPRTWALPLVQHEFEDSLYRARRPR